MGSSISFRSGVLVAAMASVICALGVTSSAQGQASPSSISVGCSTYEFTVKKAITNNKLTTKWRWCWGVYNNKAGATSASNTSCSAVKSGNHTVKSHSCTVARSGQDYLLTGVSVFNIRACAPITGCRTIATETIRQRLKVSSGGKHTVLEPK